MKPFHTFVLVNENAGEDVTPAVLDLIADAINTALASEFRAAWGYDYACRAGTDLASVGPGEKAVRIQARSTVPGAAGFHDDDSIQVFRDGLPSLISGALALSVVISHEIFETCGDLAANRWADDGQGKEYALELCDGVEAFFYEKFGISGQDDTPVALSDFLLPSFFDPAGEAPYSFKDNAKAPFTTAPASGADYQIVRKVNETGAGQVTAIEGAWHPSRDCAKRHRSSRTTRRLYGGPRAHEAPLAEGDQALPSTSIADRRTVGRMNPLAPNRRPLPPQYAPGDPRDPRIAGERIAAGPPASRPHAPPAVRPAEATTPGSFLARLFLSLVAQYSGLILDDAERAILNYMAGNIATGLEKVGAVPSAAAPAPSPPTG